MPYQTTPELIISPEEVVKLYLFGIPLCNADGRELTSDFIRQKILNAQSYLENLLYIKLIEQIIHETSDYRKTEWDAWGYVKTSFPVKFACDLSGVYNKITQIAYPHEWLASRKEFSSLEGADESVYFRQMHVVPSGGTGNPEHNGVVYNGSTPFAVFLNLNYIPNYWHSTYITGFDKVPREIIDTVGKLAAIQILTQLGDTYMGVGTNSYSIGLDGLSQNVSLLKSNEYGIYGSRIKGFGTDLWGPNGDGGDIETLKAKYKGIIWDVC